MLHLYDREERVRLLCSNFGVIARGHFQLGEKFHSDQYINVDRVLEIPDVFDQFCELIAHHYLDPLSRGVDTSLDTIVGVGSRGRLIAEGVCLMLRAKTDRRVQAIGTEKHNGSVVIDRSVLSHIRGRNVLTVADIVRTGGKARETIRQVVDLGGNNCGLATFFRRGQLTHEDLGGAKLFPLYSPDFPLWTENCPQCLRSMPLDPPPGRLQPAFDW